MNAKNVYRPIAAVFLLTLLVRVLSAVPITQPGYMDAYYYYDIALNLHHGRGFVEDFVWNYLELPGDVTHASNLFWMPLSSIMVYPFFLLLGSSYRTAQLPFVLTSALLSPLTYWLSYQLSNNRRHAFTAAALVTFSGFYTPYWVAVDSFAPFAMTGSLCLLVMHYGLSTGRRGYFLMVGILAGLSHLARADGIILLVVVLVLLAWKVMSRDTPNRGQASILSLALLLGGYLLIMAPWFGRNWRTMGTLLPGGGIKTVFLQTYDDIFSFSKELSMEQFLAEGWQTILASRARAAWHNLLTLAGGLHFFLFPLALLGLWQGRRYPIFHPPLLYLAFLYLAMSLIFPFPGIRGSMLHSATALLPFLAAAVPAALDQVVAYGKRLRPNWELATAQPFFAAGAVGLAAAFSLLIYVQSVFPTQSEKAVLLPWNQRFLFYQEVGDHLQDLKGGEAPVMVVNPPAYFYFTGRPAIVIPNDGLEATLAAASRYGATHLILQWDHPRWLSALYRGQTTYPSLKLQDTLDDAWQRPVFIYEIVTSLDRFQ
ncbi:MAG: glycosyltransferase family 39 protein [Anaerolineae bacterium]